MMPGHAPGFGHVLKEAPVTSSTTTWRDRIAASGCGHRWAGSRLASRSAKSSAVPASAACCMILAPGSLIAACDFLHPQASQCVLPHLEVDRWPSRMSVESRRDRKTSRFDREVAIMTPWCEMVGRAAGSIARAAGDRHLHAGAR
jgi:hypothetical protein